MWNKDVRLMPVWRVIKLQLAGGASCSLIALIIMQNRSYFVSALLGCIIAIIPTVVYIKIAFAKGVINYPQKALKQHKNAMVLRFLTSLLLFAVVFMCFKHCDFLVLFSTYIIVLSAYWFSLVTSRF